MSSRSLAYLVPAKGQTQIDRVEDSCDDDSDLDEPKPLHEVKNGATPVRAYKVMPKAGGAGLPGLRPTAASTEDAGSGVSFYYAVQW